MASQARHSAIQTCAERLTSRILEITHAHARDGSETNTY